MAGRQEKEVKCSVISAAQKIFARFGPSKTSVEEIAREAGFSKATVYNYFSGKEAVVAGVIENDRKALIAKLKEAIAGAADPLASLRDFFLIKITHNGADRFGYAVVFMFIFHSIFSTLGKPIISDHLQCAHPYSPYSYSCQ